MLRKIRLALFVMASFVLTALGGAWLRDRAARKRDEANAALAAANRKTAGELAQAREREARTQALENRATAEAAAQHKADLDARIISLSEYVQSRKR